MKWESKLHKIVSLFIEFVCALIIILMGYFVWDTFAIQRSADVDTYIKELKPTVNNETKEVDLSALQQINPDVVGWLTIDNTTIDYPVMQGTPDYTYLNRDFNGNRSLSGSLYISGMANRYFEDDYTIIYGHHMQGGAMFGAFDYFENEKYFNEHLTGTLITEKKIYNLTLQSLIYTDAYNEVYFKKDNESFKAFVDGKDYEIHNGTLEINDKTLLLSTCGPNGSTDRILLILKMEER